MSREEVMNDEAIIQHLKKRLRVDFLSVSDKYPNDDGCLRRMGEIVVEKTMRLSRIYKICEETAKALGGKFNDGLRIETGTALFVIAYDEYVEPPAPWSVFREDPL